MERSVLDLDEVLSILRLHLPELREHYGVASLGVFGSTVRGQQRERSDVDLLVEFERTPTLFQLVHLLAQLVGSHLCQPPPVIGGPGGPSPLAQLVGSHLCQPPPVVGGPGGPSPLAQLGGLSPGPASTSKLTSNSPLCACIAARRSSVSAPLGAR